MFTGLVISLVNSLTTESSFSCLADGTLRRMGGRSGNIKINSSWSVRGMA